MSDDLSDNDIQAIILTVRFVHLQKSRYVSSLLKLIYSTHLPYLDFYVTYVDM